MNNSIFQKIFIFSWFFLLTLQSYYSYKLNIAIPPSISAIIAFFSLPSIYNKTKSKEFISSSIKLTVYWFYITLVGLFFAILSKNILITRILASPLFLASGIFFLHLSNTHKTTLEKSIHFALKIHTSAFIIQASSYYLGFGFIDFLAPFTGEEQRAIGGSFYFDQQGNTQLIRPTGLFNEPGTYSNIVFMFFLVYQNMKFGEHNSKNFEFFDWLLLLTIIFSFSIFGILYISIYSIYLIKNNKKLLLPVIIFSLIAIPFVFEIYIYPRFFSGEYDDTGIEFRTSALETYISLISEKNPLILIFGTGIFTDISESAGNIVWNDLGLLIYFLITTGICGLSILFSTTYKTIKQNKTFIIALILMLTKISPAMILFWAILGFLLHNNKAAREIKSLKD